MTQDIIQAIAVKCHLHIARYEQVRGGDINECYCLHGQGIKYFLKLNNAARFPHMFEMEAAGLEALRNNSSMVVPEVIQTGINNNRQWLLLCWLEKGVAKKNSMENFGVALAGMHRKQQRFFGWHQDNYIGSLPQINTPCDSWSEFYTQCRIIPLAIKLFEAGIFSKKDIDAATTFCKKAAGLFPEEPPALLHGDCWGGNYMIDTNGNAAIFDPAVYYGHRETDLGMTKLFGGFSQPFYDAYHEAYPLEKGWEQRLDISQLYPLLVHAVLFGGQYVISVKEIIRKLGR